MSTHRTKKHEVEEHVLYNIESTDRTEPSRAGAVVACLRVTRPLCPNFPTDINIESTDRTEAIRARAEFACLRVTRLLCPDFPTDINIESTDRTEAIRARAEFACLRVTRPLCPNFPTDINIESTDRNWSRCWMQTTPIALPRKHSLRTKTRIFLRENKRDLKHVNVQLFSQSSVLSALALIPSS
ncbi:hypothetical protein J6590_010978 [Homalodisca vitripennis]|nr:hypothetical protein J6590_010978 [Homalodisca vitripennis]